MIYVDGTSDGAAAVVNDNNEEEEDEEDTLNHSKEEEITFVSPHLECNLCEMRFPNEEIFNKHSTNTVPFFCRVLLKKPEPERNRKGVRITTSEEPFVCNECQRSFATFSAVKKHLQAQHTGNKLYTCLLCNMDTSAFKNKQEYDDHLEQRHFTFWEEARPDEILIGAKGRKRKSKAAQKSTKHKIDTDTENETSMDNCVNDSVNVTSEIVKGRMCEICGVGFISSTEYEDHMDIEHAEMSLEPAGSYVGGFGDLAAAAAVTASHEPEEELEPGEVKVDGKFFRCEFCSLEFEEATEYINHMSSHKDELEMNEKIRQEQDRVELELLRMKEQKKKSKGVKMEDENEEEEEEEDEGEMDLHEEEEELEQDERAAEEDEEGEEYVEEMSSELQEDESFKETVENIIEEMPANEQEEDDNTQEKDEPEQEEVSVPAPERPTWKSARLRKKKTHFDDEPSPAPPPPKKQKAEGFVFSCELCTESFSTISLVKQHINDVHLALKVKEEGQAMDSSEAEKELSTAIDPTADITDLEQFISEDRDPDFDPDEDTLQESDEEEEDTNLPSIPIRNVKSEQEADVSPAGKNTDAAVVVNNPINPITQVEVDGKTFNRCSHCGKDFKNLRSAKRHITSAHVRNGMTSLPDASFTNIPVTFTLNNLPGDWSGGQMVIPININNTENTGSQEEMMNAGQRVVIEDALEKIVQMEEGRQMGEDIVVEIRMPGEDGIETVTKAELLQQPQETAPNMEASNDFDNQEAEFTNATEMPQEEEEETPNAANSSHNSTRCDACMRNFDSRMALMTHMMTVHGEREEKGTRECKHCGKEFQSMRQLNIHIAMKHKEEKLEVAEEEEEEEEEEEAKDNEETNEDTQEENEPEVGESENEPPKKRRRMIKREPGLPDSDDDYMPTKTAKKIKKKATPKDTSSSTTNSLRCDMCNKRFKSKPNLRIHQTMVHAGTGENDTRPARVNSHPFQCQQGCRSRYQTAKQLAAHKANPQCPVCEKSFTNCMLYKKHKHTHTKQEWAKLKHVQCDLCGMSFSKTAGLRLHKLVHNVCNYCDVQCDNPDELTEHLKTIHPKLVNTICPHCGLRFTKKWNLDIHVAKYHDPDKPRDSLEITVSKDGRRRGRFKGDFVCDFCGKIFEKAYEMKRHRTSHTGEKPCKCDICGEKFSTPSMRSLHRNKVHLKIKFPCSVCGEQFKYSLARNRHMERHSEVEKKFTCECCGMQFIFKSSYNTHIKLQRCTTGGEADNTNSLLKKYKCDDCGQGFQYDHTLINHRIREHEDREPYICELPECGSKFTSAPELIYHRKGHGLDEYHCGACRIEFSSHSSLQFHDKQFHKARMHRSCTICGVVCRGDGAYIEHQQKTHTPSDRVQCSCDICGKSFEYKSAMQRHTKLKHNPNKPYRCKVCQRAFKTEEELYQHKMERHPPGQAFSCKFCPSSYNYLATLVRHMKDKHGVLHGGIQNPDAVAPAEHFIDSESGGLYQLNHRNGQEFLVGPMTPQHQSLEEGLEGERLYKCTICSAAYHHVNTLNKHMREKHNSNSHGPPLKNIHQLRSAIKVVGGRKAHQALDQYEDSVGKLQIAEGGVYEDDVGEEIENKVEYNIIDSNDASQQQQVVYMVQDSSQDGGEQYVLSIPDNEIQQQQIQYTTEANSGGNVRIIQDESGQIQVVNDDGSTNDSLHSGLRILQQGVECMTENENLEHLEHFEHEQADHHVDNEYVDANQSEVKYVDEQGQEIQYVLDTSVNASTVEDNGEDGGGGGGGMVAEGMVHDGSTVVMGEDGQQYIMVDNGNGEMVYIMANAETEDTVVEEVGS